MNKKNGTSLSGLWVRESKSGRKYMSGTTREDVTISAGTNICIFKNDKAGNDKRPDYNLIVYTKAEDREVNHAPAEQEPDADAQECPF